MRVREIAVSRSRVLRSRLATATLAACRLSDLTSAATVLGEPVRLCSAYGASGVLTAPGGVVPALGLFWRFRVPL